MSSLECKHDRLARACTECEAEQTIVDLNIVLDAYKSALGMTVDALGFLQGTAPAAFLGRPLAEYAAHLIKELTASNTRLREAYLIMRNAAAGYSQRCEGSTTKLDKDFGRAEDIARAAMEGK